MRRSLQVYINFGLITGYFHSSPVLIDFSMTRLNLLCVQSMGGVISDEDGLGYYSIINQEMGRSDSDSEKLDGTPRSRRGGPQLDEHGKRKARNKSA